MSIGPTIENLRKKRAYEASMLDALYALPTPYGGFENSTPADLASLRSIGLTGQESFSDPYQYGMDYGNMRPVEGGLYSSESVPQSAEYYARGVSKNLLGERATRDLFGSGRPAPNMVGDMIIGGGLLGAIGAKAPLTAWDAGVDAARGNYGKAAIGGLMSAIEGAGLSEVAAGAKGLKNVGNIGSYLDEGMFNVADTPATRQYFADNMRVAQASHGPIGKSVDVYTPDEYAGTRMAMTPAGDAGYVVKPDGEIASVVKAKGSPTKDFAGSVMRRSESQGGNWLNAFDTALTDLYGRNGFQPVSRLPFNEEMAQDAWGKEALDAFMQANAKYSGGKPDLVFMARNPSAGVPDRTARGGFATDDYDIAMQKLNDEMIRLGYRK